MTTGRTCSRIPAGNTNVHFVGHFNAAVNNCLFHDDVLARKSLRKRRFEDWSIIWSPTIAGRGEGWDVDGGTPKEGR